MKCVVQHTLTKQSIALVLSEWNVILATRLFGLGS